MFKDFHKDFDHILELLKKGENFAFTRFSDGELFVLRNQTVVLASDHYITGNVYGPNKYTEEEYKEFYPELHQKQREKLIDCYLHNQHNYFKGICTATDGHVGIENFRWMIKFHGGDHENLTFSNLLINANYKRFVHDIMPLLHNKKIIYVVNKAAKTENLPFKLVKKFEIGTNCMVNDYGVTEDIKKYIQENNIVDHVVLCSAATLSNFIIYECFKDNSNNTYLDIGSCLNPMLGLEGWKYTRGYLTHFWLNSNSHYGNQVDIWPCAL